MEKLNNKIAQLEAKISEFEKANPSVSNATVGWQIEHSLKTISLVANSIQNSDPKNFKWKFNKIRLLLSITNKIPRGKVKAPKLVLPDDNINQESLKKSLEKVKTQLQNWNDIHKNQYFTHPFFGDLNKKSTEWFLNLHTNHHLKIINDICKN